MPRGYNIENNPRITGIMTAFINEFNSDYRFRGESHDFWELVCVIDGQISVASDSKIFKLKKGQAILHSPMQFHNITAMGNSPSAIAVFSFLGENIPDIEDRVCDIRDISKVKSLVESAKKYYKFRHKVWITEPITNDNTHLIYVKKLELFLIELASHLIQSKQTVSQSAENYSLIVNTMEKNIYKRLSVTELAELCNMSKINLQKTFSRYAGVGVIEYFNRLKMRKADELLNEGVSVKETALRLGFHDQNYFSTVFKRIMGRTPSNRI